jgi:hypothetical protein
MNKEFVPYEEALALKKLGFDEPCLGAYFIAGKQLHICEYIKDNKYMILAPTFSQLFRWFREKYGLYSCIMYSSDGIIKGGYSPMIDVMKPHKATLDLNTYDIYEEAELVVLKN